MSVSLKVKSLIYFSIYAVLVFIYHSHDLKPNANPPNTSKSNTISHFISLLDENNSKTWNTALNRIDSQWTDAYEIMLLEVIYFTKNHRNANKLIHLLEKKTGKRFGFDYDKWYQWIWNKEAMYTADYFNFKAELHQYIDPKFKNYFLNRADKSTIRLDEVRWGGVLQDGIPPLKSPNMISASDARYLSNGATVFGIEVNGDVRAYPKQILAWHEMFVDKVGGVDVAGVYCTLCGTVILFKTEHEGKNYELGTSGFLYRSNKLMYDKATQSLWSTFEGEPVIGPLVGKGIQLDYLSVVTTTWGQWKKRHPDTKVLSLKTGHRRDYREGVAYNDYFATDELMFSVPKIDRRLNNKDEILSVRLPGETDENLAISSNFLKSNPIYQNRIKDINFTVFTDKTAAHRTYLTGELHFKSYKNNRAVDSEGTVWILEENRMISQDGKILERLPTHNAFWFGYHAAFPEAVLIK